MFTHPISALILRMSSKGKNREKSFLFNYIKKICVFLNHGAIAINCIFKVQEGRYTKVKKVFCGYESQNF